MTLNMVEARCSSMLHLQTTKHADINDGTEGNNEAAASWLHINIVVHRRKFISNINYYGNAN